MSDLLILGAISLVLAELKFMQGKKAPGAVLALCAIFCIAWVVYRA